MARLRAKTKRGASFSEREFTAEAPALSVGIHQRAFHGLSVAEEVRGSDDDPFAGLQSVKNFDLGEVSGSRPDLADRDDSVLFNEDGGTHQGFARNEQGLLTDALDDFGSSRPAGGKLAGDSSLR